MPNKTPNPIDKYVGSRIRMRRLMLSMSQEKLADALGLTFQQVQKYEKGTNRVGASRLQAISNALEVPVSFFFDGAPGVRGAAAVGNDFTQAFLATRDGLALARLWPTLPDNVRHQLVVLAGEIVGGNATAARAA